MMKQEEQQGGGANTTRRRAATNRSNVAAGSVWETRMKMDLVKGGIKVFTAQANINKDEQEEEEEGIKINTNLRSDDLSPNPNVERRKRRSWKTPQPTAAGEIKSPIELLKARSELIMKDDEDDDEIEIGGDGKNFDDKEIDLPEKNIHEIEIAPFKEQQPEEDDDEAEIVKEPNSIELEEEEMVERSSEPEAPKRMQSIFDLVMWRDVSRSAFVFGAGTFILLSSSYTRDLNFSLLSATSYLALFYLSLVFIFKSILRRGEVEFDERGERCIIGEEEAIRALRYLLPYINEVIVRLKALFSGDPATTMKLAVVLFLVARCGGAVTVWTLAKIVFFGVFTVPKVLSSYSLVLARYGKFWIERFRDGWESCTHKKAVTVAVFILVWNMSSTAARIWAVFMLVVAVKLYQQYAVELNEEEEEVVNEVQQQQRQEEDSKPKTKSSRVRVTAAGINGLQQHPQRCGPKLNELKRDITKVKKRT